MKKFKEKVIAIIGSKQALFCSVGATVSTLSVVPAYASVGDVSSAVTAGLGLFSATVSTLTSNPIFLAILGCALIPVGFRVFRAAKNAVH